MKKDYIKPFVKVKVLDTELCQFGVTSDPAKAISAEVAGSKEMEELFDFILDE